MTLLTLPFQLGEKSTPIITRQQFNERDEMGKADPCVIYEGEPYTDNELYFIMMDNTQIATTRSLTTAMKVLMGTICVMNGAYPKAHVGYFTFLQKIIMNQQDRQPRVPKVIQLAGKIGKELP